MNPRSTAPYRLFAVKIGSPAGRSPIRKMKKDERPKHADGSEPQLIIHRWYDGEAGEIRGGPDVEPVK
jgi:hypothetical protein